MKKFLLILFCVSVSSFSLAGTVKDFTKDFSILLDYDAKDALPNPCHLQVSLVRSGTQLDIKLGTQNTCPYPGSIKNDHRPGASMYNVSGSFDLKSGDSADKTLRLQGSIATNEIAITGMYVGGVFHIEDDGSVTSTINWFSDVDNGTPGVWNTGLDYSFSALPH
jgi:hypothetical protein